MLLAGGNAEFAFIEVSHAVTAAHKSVHLKDNNSWCNQFTTAKLKENSAICMYYLYTSIVQFDVSYSLILHPLGKSEEKRA